MEKFNPQKNNFWAKYYPQKILRIREHKLFSNLPLIFYKKEEGQEWEEFKIYNLIKPKKLKDIISWSEDLFIRKPNHAFTIDFVNGIDGKQIFFNVEDIIIYFETEGIEKKLTTISNVNVGTFPLIRITEYGLNRDVITYQSYLKGDNFGDANSKLSDKERKEVAKKLLSKEIKDHNLGLIRATIFRDNVDEQHRLGQPTITKEIKTKIAELDFVENKINKVVDLSSDHVAMIRKEGTDISPTLNKSRYLQQVLDNDQKEPLNVSWDNDLRKLVSDEYGSDFLSQLNDDIDEFNIEQQLSGDTKFYGTDVANQDELIGEIVSANNLEGLKNLKFHKIMEIDQLLYLLQDYKSEGSAQETSAKIDKVGESGRLGITRIKVDREIQYKEVFEKVFKILEIDYYDIKVNFTIEDKELQLITLRNNPQWLSMFPSSYLMELLGIDLLTAKQLIDEADKELEENKSKFLANTNGNGYSELDLPYFKDDPKPQPGMGGAPGGKPNEKTKKPNK